MGREVERIFENIINDITSGALPPGTKLNGPELARRFGCSRGPVREAFRRLEERKLIQCTPNAGARVVEHTPQEVIEAYEIREALEGLAARLAAQHMSDAELLELRQSFEAEVARGRSGGFRNDFHMQIVRGSHNERLMRLLNEEYYAVFRMWHLSFPWLQRGGDNTWVDHRRILEAIELHDDESAELLMRRHIRRLRIQSIENLRRSGLADSIDPVRRRG
jgi:DNA-binding GntR family transcriptional regulator